MAGKSEFYRGRRKRKSVFGLLFAILVVIVSLIVVLFYGMQKYAVITKDEVRIDLNGSSGTAVQSGTNQSTRTFSNVDVKIAFKDPDYMSMESTAGRGLDKMRAVFIPYDQINRAKIESSVSRLSTGNSIVIEMKPRGGNLMWHSESPVALKYNLNYDSETTANIQSYVDYIKEHSVWAVAQISCLVDYKLATQSADFGLKSLNGANYSDETGAWVDPFNATVRSYIIDLVEELYAMGFDEVVLADVAHPSLPDDYTIGYSMPMSSDPTPEKGVLGFAYTISQHFEGRKEVLSIYTGTAFSLVKTDKATGQNTPVFLKMFDRVYYLTDKYTYTFNLQDIERSISKAVAAYRFVPVVVNYLPSDPANISWVLIDVEE